jgi:hypothetical protein
MSADLKKRFFERRFGSHDRATSSGAVKPKTAKAPDA